MRLRTLGAFFAISTALLAARPALAACTDSSFSGAFGFFYGRTAGVGLPTADSGQVTSNGKGSITGTWIQSLDGTITSATFTGTYTMGDNCAGTMTWNNSNRTVYHFDFYLDNSNKAFQMLRTDSGHTQPGYGIAQGTAACELTGRSQTYILNLYGTLTADGKPKAVVGEATLNGHGDLTGSATVSVNFSLVGSGLPFTGTYTVNSNCTGTVKISIQGESEMNFDMVIVAGGATAILFENDNDTLIAGTALYQE
jgi:hypothetical protein